MKTSYEKLKAKKEELEALAEKAKLAIGTIEKGDKGNFSFGHANQRIYGSRITEQELDGLCNEIEKIYERASEEAASIKSRLDAVDDLLGGKGL